jgi:hypothetical protein
MLAHGVSTNPPLTHIRSASPLHESAAGGVHSLASGVQVTPTEPWSVTTSQWLAN